MYLFIYNDIKLIFMKIHNKNNAKLFEQFKINIRGIKSTIKFT